jgi:cellulose synthase/poly-beta-1,6-N-acetylglucosamine synthase-like glycosyltransferase
VAPTAALDAAAVSAALIAAVFYVVFLLNPDYRGDTWLWVLVLMAELLTVLHALGTWWTILANDNAPDRPEVYAMRRRLLSGELRPTIDVFITACGEPIEIILGTVYAARDMRIDHRTWVLDDGRSDALRDACEAVGVGTCAARAASTRRQATSTLRWRAPTVPSSSSSTPTTCRAPTSWRGRCPTCMTTTSRSSRRRKRSRAHTA